MLKTNTYHKGYTKLLCEKIDKSNNITFNKCSLFVQASLRGIVQNAMHVKLQYSISVKKLF